MLGKTLVDWMVWLLLGFLDTFFKTIGFLLALAFTAAVAGFGWAIARLGAEAKRRYDLRKAVDKHFAQETAQAK